MGFIRTKGIAVAAAVATVLAAPVAKAQERINVTVLSGYTDRTAWVKLLKEFWMPEVNKRLAETGNYTLNYTEAFGTCLLYTSPSPRDA